MRQVCPWNAPYMNQALSQVGVCRKYLGGRNGHVTSTVSRFGDFQHDTDRAFEVSHADHLRRIKCFAFRRQKFDDSKIAEGASKNRDHGTQLVLQCLADFVIRKRRIRRLAPGGRT